MIHLGTATRVCFVKFKDPSSVHVAQHLTNTVFIDRALIVVPVSDGEFNLELGKFLWRGGEGSYPVFVVVVVVVVIELVGTVSPRDLPSCCFFYDSYCYGS